MREGEISIVFIAVYCIPRGGKLFETLKTNFVLWFKHEKPQDTYGVLMVYVIKRAIFWDVIIYKHSVSQMVFHRVKVRVLQRKFH